MAKLKWDKSKSLDDGEVILEPVQDIEQFAGRGLVEEVNNVVEVEVQPEAITKSDLQAAKLLEGTPKDFGELTEVFEKLSRYGIAANFGGGQYAQGHKWESMVR